MVLLEYIDERRSQMKEDDYYNYWILAERAKEDLETQIKLLIDIMYEQDRILRDLSIIYSIFVGSEKLENLKDKLERIRLYDPQTQTWG